MKLYSIRDWNDLYENNRSRKVIDLSWVAIPNRHDGENYATIVSHKQGSIIFSAWVLIVQVASRCQPRGTLIRDNKTPHTALSLSIKTRAPREWFEIALDYLEKNTDWIEVQELAVGCQSPATVLPPSCQSGDEEGKGKNGREGSENHISWKTPEVKEESRKVLLALNRLARREFRETDDNLKLIGCRLLEVERDVDGMIRMITRMCSQWINDVKMNEFLRPSTLFGKEKFGGYYDNRNMPVLGKSNGETPKPESPHPNSDAAWKRHCKKQVAERTASGIAIPKDILEGASDEF